MDEFRVNEAVLKETPPSTPPPFVNIKQTKPPAAKFFPCSMCSLTLPFKSRLYAHYSTVHFREKLIERFGDTTNCPLCNKRLYSKDGMLMHMGGSHNFIEQFLEPQHHVRKTSEQRVSPCKNYVSCYLCLFTTSDKNSLYSHYCLLHFKEQLLITFQNDTTCFSCNKELSNDVNEKILHIGVSCSYIENCLPIQHHVRKAKAGQPNDNIKLQVQAFNGLDNSENLNPNVCVEKLSNVELLNDSKKSFFICSLCYTYTATSRTLLFRHYAFKHFQQQLLDKFHGSNKCPDCERVCLSKLGKVSHMFVAHKYIEEFLKKETELRREEPVPSSISTHSTKPSSAKVEEYIKKLSHTCFSCCFSSTCRNTMYTHYANVHFKQELNAKYPDPDSCPLCNQSFMKESAKLSHLGSRHNAVEPFLEKGYIIPRSRKESVDVRPEDEENTRDESEERYSAQSSNSIQIKCSMKDLQESTKDNSTHTCFSCSYTSTIRSRMYTHYAMSHFKEEIISKYPGKNICPLCSYKYKNEKSKLIHLGCRHSVVEPFLKKEYIISKGTPVELSSTSIKSEVQKEEESDHTDTNSQYNCFSCSFSSSTRISIYEHYALVHFKKEINVKYPGKDLCPLCNKKYYSEKSKLVHLGYIHSAVEPFLKKEFIIPKRSNTKSSYNNARSNAKEVIVEDQKKTNDSNSIHTCFSCSYSSSSKKHIYTHYALVHFNEKIIAKYPNEDFCSICSHQYKSKKGKLLHLGIAHDMVDSFLPQRHRIPRKKRQKKSFSPIIQENMVKEKVETEKKNRSQSSGHQCHICDFSDSKRYRIYSHYSNVHYRKKFVKEYNLDAPCHLCDVINEKSFQMIAHLGATHDLVERFLPKKYRVPLSKKGPKKVLESADCQIDQHAVKKKHLLNPLQCSKCDLVAKNASLLYQHYALQHFRALILKQYGEQSSCSLCELKFASRHQQLSHLGMKHRIVEKFLKKKFHLPLNYKGTKDKDLKYHLDSSSQISNSEEKVTKQSEPEKVEDGPCIEGETFEVYMDIAEDIMEECIGEDDPPEWEEDLKENIESWEVGSNNSEEISCAESKTGDRYYKDCEIGSKQDKHKAKMDEDKDIYESCNEEDEDESDASEVEINAGDLGIQLDDSDADYNEEDYQVKSDSVDTENQTESNRCKIESNVKSSPLKKNQPVVDVDVKKIDKVQVDNKTEIVTDIEEAKQEGAMIDIDEEKAAAADKVEKEDEADSSEEAADTNEGKDEGAAAADVVTKEDEADISEEEADTSEDKDEGAAAADVANEDEADISEEEADTSEDEAAADANVVDEDEADTSKDEGAADADVVDEEEADTSEVEDENEAAADANVVNEDEAAAATDVVDEEEAAAATDVVDEQEADTSENEAAADADVVDEDEAAAAADVVDEEKADTSEDEEEEAADNDVVDEEEADTSEEDEAAAAAADDVDKEEAAAADVVDKEDSAAPDVSNEEKAATSEEENTEAAAASEVDEEEAANYYQDEISQKASGTLLLNDREVELRSGKCGQKELRLDPKELSTAEHRTAHLGLSSAETGSSTQEMGSNMAEIGLKLEERGSDHGAVESKGDKAELEMGGVGSNRVKVKTEPGIRKIDIREICFVESDTDSEFESE